MALSAPRPDPAPDYTPQQHPGPGLSPDQALKLARLLKAAEVPERCGCPKAAPVCRCRAGWPHCGADREAACSCGRWPHCDGDVLHYPPCPCVKKMPQTLPAGMTYEEWARLLLLLHPAAPAPGKMPGEGGDGYGELPEPPPTPAAALTRAERVDLYATRHRAGRALFSPRDAFNALEAGCAVLASKGRSQVDVIDGRAA